MSGGIQGKAELDDFYVTADPWDYDSTRDDTERAARVLSALPVRPYRRTIDIGCGNGFLTVRLPGDQVLGVDLSERAVEWARQRAAREAPDRDLRFESRSLFDLNAVDGDFDLVVVTGVLYPQYIGKATAVVTEILKALVAPGGVLMTVHIDAWARYRAPFTTLAISVDPYREYFHRLEVFQR